jgi:hypothetical protein
VANPYSPHERFDHLDGAGFANAVHLVWHCARYRDLPKRPTLGIRGHADVAVRDHPHHAVVGVEDRKGAAVAFPHDLRGPLEIIVGAARGAQKCPSIPAETPSWSIDESTLTELVVPPEVALTVCEPVNGMSAVGPT